MSVLRYRPRGFVELPTRFPCGNGAYHTHSLEKIANEVFDVTCEKAN